MASAVVLKGHGFSRAADRAEQSRALALEEKLKDGQHSVMKQLPVFMVFQRVVLFVSESISYLPSRRRHSP
jgi:hypothetical protein